MMAGVVSLPLILLTISCNNTKSKKPADVPGYDIGKPVIVKLKSALDEISGITYYPKDTSVFAINDELGVLYKVYMRKKIKIEQWEFSKGSDYEDLVLVDSTFYALHSNGDITRFRIFSEDSSTVDEFEIPISGKNEFEAMYYDSTRGIVIICKECETDKNEAYVFDPKTATYDRKPAYTIDISEIMRKQKQDEKEYKPSAAAIHPLTNELYIMSSVNKCIVTADLDGKVKEVYPINPALFKQPEGLTFTPKGDMLISNESAESGVGNILIFKRKQ